MMKTLLLLLASSLCCVSGSSWSRNRALKKEDDADFPTDYLNDLYHCFAPDSKSNENDDGIDCNALTFKWNVTQLDADEMPERCQDMEFDSKDIRDDNDDYIEPCIWWHLFYGDLRQDDPPDEEAEASLVEDDDEEAEDETDDDAEVEDESEAPSSPAPSAGPTDAASLEPTSAPSFTEESAPAMTPSPETASPSANLRYKPVRFLSDFVLQLILPPPRRLRGLRSNDSSTLLQEHDVMMKTSTHLESYFSQALGTDVLAVLLTVVASEMAQDYVLQEYKGRVVFLQDTILPSQNALNTLLKNAFEGELLEHYLDGYESNSVLFAEVMVAQSEAAASSDNDDDAPLFDTGLIVVMAGGGAALMAVCLLGYLLFTAKSRAATLALSKNASHETKQALSEEGAPEDDDDDDKSSDRYSDLTSVYSYKHQATDYRLNQGNEDAYSLAEKNVLGAAYDDDNSMQAPSVLWNGEGNNDPSTVMVRRGDDGATKNGDLLSYSARGMHYGVGSFDDSILGQVAPPGLDYGHDDDSMIGGAEATKVLQLDDSAYIATNKRTSDIEFRNVWDSREEDGVYIEDEQNESSKDIDNSQLLLNNTTVSKDFNNSQLLVLDVTTASNLDLTTASQDQKEDHQVTPDNNIDITVDIGDDDASARMMAADESHLLNNMLDITADDVSPLDPRKLGDTLMLSKMDITSDGDSVVRMLGKGHLDDNGGVSFDAGSVICAEETSILCAEDVACAEERSVAVVKGEERLAL